LAGDTYLINFQLAGAPVPTRYLVDGGHMFGLRSSGLTYGWSTDHTDQTRDRGIHPDQRLDTLVHIEQNQFWEMQLPNGNYEVTVSVGDPANNDGLHTINVEGVNFWTNLQDTDGFATKTMQVTVSDGRLTMNQGAALDKATRVNYIHIVGLPSGANAAPNAPTITEPAADLHPLNPSDVHMEAINFVDTDGNAHKSTDWEIWTVGANPEPVWQTLGIQGVERLHTHMGDGLFINSHAGRTSLIADSLANFDFNTYSLTLPGVTAGDHLTVTVEMIDAAGGSGSSISGMVDAFTLLSPTLQNLIQDGGFELATTDTQTSNSNWVMTTEHDGVEPSAMFIAAPWAASAGAKGVWFKGFRGSPGSPVDASVTQTVTATASGDYKLSFAAKVEEFFPDVIGGFRVTITSDGTGGSRTIDLLNPTTREYELRVRFRDDAGAVSGYATRRFFVGHETAVFPLELQDIATIPAHVWLNAAENNVVLPPASPNQSELRLESADGQLLLSILGGSPNTVTNPPALSDHANLRVVLQAGSNGLTLTESTLTFRNDHGLEHTVYLPAVSLGANQRLDLWVASDGSTYYGTAAQTEPDFSDIARRSDQSVPFVVTKPGFVIEEVAGDFQLPVNIAFVPNPGSDPDDPLFYVAELYGTIKMVTRDYTVSTYATGLLNFNPTGSFPGSGEQGLAGIVVDPLNGDLFVTRVHSSSSNPDDDNAPHYPQVVRLSSTNGGRTASSVTVIRDMPGETMGQSHQISNITFGPDDMLYVHVGDGFDSSTAQNLNSYRGKVLRMTRTGAAPTDNPFYNAGNGINSADYVYAYGVRNPFGGAWRISDAKHYEVENGPSVDRLAQINRGVNYGWNGSDASMTTLAIYNWNPATAPVNIQFVQSGVFDGSQFPSAMLDHAFVTESGPTYALGQQSRGKEITEFTIDASGVRTSGPTTFVEYIGGGRATVAALAAGPDGLYFSELYKDLDAVTPIDAGARIFRVRYINRIPGDYDIDGDHDAQDQLPFTRNFGSNLLLAADANNNKVVDAADYVVWRKFAGIFTGAGGDAAEANVSSSSLESQSAAVSVEVAEATPSVTLDSSLTSVSYVDFAFDPRATPPAATKLVRSHAGSPAASSQFAIRDRALLMTLRMEHARTVSKIDNDLASAAANSDSQSATDVDEVFADLAGAMQSTK
jgi:glucose/arabinose dehydrogenase